MKRPLVIVLGLTALVHGIVAFCTPILGDDWAAWSWAAEHRGDGAAHYALYWLGRHFQTSQALAYAMARSDGFFIVCAVVAFCALLVGVYALAMRRLPRATWDDALGLLLLSALLWLVQSRAGVAFFHRYFVATGVAGTALAVWWLVPLRCRLQLPRRMTWLMIAGALAIGTTTHSIATATLVAAIAALRRMPRDARPAYLRPGAIVLAISTIAGYVLPPWLAVARAARRGFAYDAGLLDGATRAGGTVLLVIAALVLVDRYRERPRPSDAPPEPRETLLWAAVWIALAAFAQLDPRYSDATLVPSSAAFGAGAVPYLQWLARGSLRRALVAGAVAVHVLFWTRALVAHVPLRGQWLARREVLEHALPGTTAIVKRYEDAIPLAWTYGEDFGDPLSRQSIAIGVFGLRDITVEPSFGAYEENPGLGVALEITGAPPEAVAAASPPVWGTIPALARGQLVTLLDHLDRALGRTVDAKLVARDLDFPGRHGRPILVAWRTSEQHEPLRVGRSRRDARYGYKILIRDCEDQHFDEAWQIEAGVATRVTYTQDDADRDGDGDGVARVLPKASDATVLVVCNAALCYVADAFVPKF